MKKLSIITINFNNRNGLQKTIDSVIHQTYKDFEWIIIDGGSTDGSKELIEQYNSYITYWVSEPDKGIYNAMNKGIKVANGEYLLFLNSGDWLYEKNTMHKIHHLNLTSDFIIFNIKLFYNEHHIETKNLQRLKNGQVLQFLYNDTFPHQSTLIRKSIIVENQLYDEKYKYVADWYLCFKACIWKEATYIYIPQLTLSYYDTHGISSTLMNQVINERIQILQKELPSPIKECIERSIMLENITSQIEKGKISKFLYRILLKLSAKINN